MVERPYVLDYSAHSVLFLFYCYSEMIRDQASFSSTPGLCTSQKDSLLSSSGSNSSYAIASKPALASSHVSHTSQLNFVVGALPDIPMVQLEFMFKLLGCDAEKTVNFFVEGVSLSSVVDAIRSSMIDAEDNEKRLLVTDMNNVEELTGVALQFYQGSFDPRSQLFVEVIGSDVIDGGGVRRQFLYDVLANLSGKLFEGQENRMRPILKQSSINSGILTAVGRMVGHSILLEGQGFPYLSPACYHYLTGHTDKALSCLSTEDVGERVRRVVTKVHNSYRFWKQLIHPTDY